MSEKTTTAFRPLSVFAFSIMIPLKYVMTVDRPISTAYFGFQLM